MLCLPELSKRVSALNGAQGLALTSVQKGLDVFVFPQGRVVQIMSQGADGVLRRQRRQRHSICLENKAVNRDGIER